MLEEEDLAGNSEKMGRIMMKELSSLNPDIVSTVRGRGLFQAIVLKQKNGKLCFQIKQP